MLTATALLAGIAAGAGMAIGALGSSEGERPSPGSERRGSAPRVLVRTTGHDSELRKTVPITRRHGAARRVVISMGPGNLPRLRRGDRTKLTAELQVTNDCIVRSPRCAGRPYHYDSVVRARLLLVRERSATGGRAARPVARRERMVCRQKLPNRTHHCVVVFTRASYSHRDTRRVGCAPSDCRVNLVLDAHSPRAGNRHKLVIGGNRPDGTILQDKARINAIRLRPGSQPRVRPKVTRRTVTDRLPLTERPHVVFSKRLRGLRAGVQLAVSSRMKTAIGHLPYNVRVNSRLLLTGGRRATERSRLAKRVASLKGEISEGNGYNCTQIEAPCTSRKVGVLRIKRDPPRRGRLYVNVIVVNQAKRATPARSHRAKVARGGLRIVRYPASRGG